MNFGGAKERLNSSGQGGGSKVVQEEGVCNGKQKQPVEVKNEVDPFKHTEAEETAARNTTTGLRYE